MRRIEAISLGLSHYDTGKPCKNGHLSKRQTRNGTCLKCSISASGKYRSANPGYGTEPQRLYRASNREMVRKWTREQSARRRDADPQAEAARIAAWISDNRDRYQAIRRVNAAKRRARKLSAGGSFTAEEFDAVCAQQKGRCFYCGKKAKLEADHYEPISRGGSNDIENIRGACRGCNASKCAKHPVDFALERGFLCF